MHRAKDAAGLVVEAELRPGIADVADYFTRDAVVVDVGFGSDFAGDYHEASGEHGLARDARSWILSQRGIEDGVRYLVGDFVGVTLGDRLRSKQNSVVIILQ